MKKFFVKNIWYITGAAVVIIAGGTIWYVSASHAPALGVYTVTRGNVVESVDIPATVSSDNSVDLSFQEPGQIAHVYVQEGAAVSAGQTLADLDASSFSASLVQANAGLAAAQAQLDELASGTRPQQLTIDQSAVTSAEATLSVQVGSAYTAADDAVRNQADNLFINPDTTNPTFVVPVTDSQAQINIQSERVVLGTALDAWYAAENSPTSTTASITTLANTDLAQAQTYLDAIALAVESAVPSGSLSASQLAAYKVEVATARNEMQEATAGLTGAESALSAAQDALVLAQAGPTSQDIAAQQAAVLQAQAQVDSAQVAVNRASLTAPFPGTAQNVTAQVGQVVSPGVPVMSLVNNGALKIEGYVSESDVAKIKEGDAANVTLDAYGEGTVFPATIAAIDTAETQVNGSPAYQVTLYFAQPDSRIRAGMTGNAHIVVAEHDNVLSIPAGLVINNGDNNFVLLTNGNTPVQQPVTLGITGDNNMVEITSGLNDGDHISSF